MKQFDTDGDKRLNATERKAAMEFLKKEPAEGRGPRRGFRGGPDGPGGPGGFGPPGMGREDQEPAKPGVRLSPADVKPAANTNLYAADTLRTLFLQFENDGWDAEMQAFKNTDVEVPAKLTVDGKEFTAAVGVKYRGASSFMMVRPDRKRSLNLSIDFADKKQRLDGYKTLNLLNSNGDESMMSTVLYSEIARHYLPVPKANFVRVVINGENWGVYTNVQQFNKEFVQENFRTEKGARWKVSGSPGGGGGLDYIGEDIAKYKEKYEIKSADNEEDWKALIQLCRTLKETPADKLEEALKPILDLEGLLWFLALDAALINTDGYWIRASDYSIYRDTDGKFHILPHDMNEAFTTPHGPGMGGFRGPGGPGGFGRRGGRDGNRPPEGDPAGDRPPELAAPRPGQGPATAGEPPRNGAPVPPAPTADPGNPDRPRLGADGPALAPGPRQGGNPVPPVKGVELDPLVGLDDTSKPLRSRILGIPALRERYLANVRTIADQWLDWKNLGPIVAKYRALIEREVELDTRKLHPFAAFQKATADTPPESPAAPEANATPERRRGPTHMPLRAFADQRRAYLLKQTAGQTAGKTAPATAGK